MELSYIARQPILDRNKALYGYELLFRNSIKNTFPQVSAEEATTKLVIEQFFKDSDSILGEKFGFINFPYSSLTQQLPKLLPKEKVIIEILEDCKPTKELLQAIIKLKSEGYTLALDDFIPSPQWKPFLPYIDIIKFDIQILPLDKLEKLMGKMKSSNIRFLAEKVETYEEFEQAINMGFELFQGYFFSKPEVIQQRKITPSQIAVIDLCQSIAQEEIDYKALEKTFSSDVTLSFNLLRFVNSANVVTPIQSFSQALAFLGEENLRRFVSLVAIASVSEKKPDSLYALSVQRARFCELIYRELPNKMDSSQAFLVGLLSLLDALFDNDLENITSQLPISEKLRAALINGSGSLGKVLSLARAYEVGDWAIANTISRELSLDSKLTFSLYNKAIRWVEIN